MTGWKWIAVGAVLASATGLSAMLVLRNAGLPVSAANGTYSNKCCGDLILRDGKMIMGEKAVSYVVEQDGGRSFILPKTYVGTWEERGFQIDGGRLPERLRIDRFPYPTAIKLNDLRSFFVFRRRPPAVG